MTDHMRTHALIVQSDFEHLAIAARGVVGEIARRASGADTTSRFARAQLVESTARQMARLVAGHDAESVEWQTAIGHGSLDDLLQALRVSLEQVDPAREAVA